MELVPIRVTITLGNVKGKRMIYPAFNAACAEVLNGLDWCHYVDQFGGPHLDKKCMLQEEGTATPHGEQYVLYLVEESFSDLAVAAFPDTVERLEEEDAEVFYDERAHDHEPAQQLDGERLMAIRARYGVEGDLIATDTKGWDEDDIKSIDPEHPSPGIVENKRKTFDKFKTLRNITIKPKK